MNRRVRLAFLRIYARFIDMTTSKTHKFVVRGHVMKTRTVSRFVVVQVTSDKWAVVDEGTYRAAVDARGFRMIFATEAEAVAAHGAGQVVQKWSDAGAEIMKRSDSFATARTHASRIGACVVIDTETGEEISS